MSAKDLIHDAVRNALEKDGWTITDDPLTLKYQDKHVLVDLGANRLLLAAERRQEKIAVEIKSFLSPSITKDLQEALGQYLTYLAFLDRRRPDVNCILQQAILHTASLRTVLRFEWFYVNIRSP